MYSKQFDGMGRWAMNSTRHLEVHQERKIKIGYLSFDFRYI
jgi:hypothetical protein